MGLRILRRGTTITLPEHQNAKSEGGFCGHFLLKTLRIPLWLAGCLVLTFASARYLAFHLAPRPFLPLFLECLACTLLGSFFFVTLNVVEALVVCAMFALLLNISNGLVLHNHPAIRELIAIALITGFALSRLFRALSCDGLEDPFTRKAFRLASMPCPACAQPIGPGSAIAARDQYLHDFAEARRRRPKSKISFVRYWLVDCPSCHAKSEFHFETLDLKTRDA
jgi:hypothetical protein